MQLKQNDIKYEVFGCYTLLIVNCMSNNINIYAFSCFYLKREIKAICQGANNIRNVQF